jgi:2-polyprenyl-3-methyl-5-hydroxy-6-metoxy-1,4-benzoquinol methylase
MVIKKKCTQWDKRQDKRGKAGEVMADDTKIAWPAMVQLLNDNHMGDIRVLDYSCGTGAFCRRLRSEGFHVEGMDLSPQHVRSASRQSSEKIRFHVGGKAALKDMAGAYDAITSLMGFQFLEDFESYLPLFSELLNDRGLVVFAVFNPDFVESCHKNNMIFTSLKTVGKTTVARMETKKGGAVDTYIRNKDQYRKLFEKHGFEYLSSRYPPFTPEFVNLYKWKLPTDDAEYLVMAVRKKTKRIK